MTDYLLDTNALLVMALESVRTPPPVRQAFSEGGRFVSHISAIEIAIKHSIGKLRLPSAFDMDFAHAFNEIVRRLGAGVVGVELSHIAVLARLPLLHRDPFDRLIIAQALVGDMTVITRDRTFKAYTGLSVIEI